MEVYMFVASQAWFYVDDYCIEHNVRGCNHIIDELRWERLYLVLVSYRLFYQRIFVFDMIYFIKIRHFKLSSDIILMSVCQVFAEFSLILVARSGIYLQRLRMQKAHPVVSLVTKAQWFVDIATIQKKVDLYSFKCITVFMYYVTRV